MLVQNVVLNICHALHRLIKALSPMLQMAETSFGTDKPSIGISKRGGYISCGRYFIIYCRAMLEGKSVNASQALNYCKHMVTICQEAMAGNHSLM
nr:hypothetical protein CFP56_72290 [Quercus suber]